MKEFKDFGIKPTIVGFVGESINIDKTLNKKIVVHKFTIGPSKKKENSKCLTLQIEVDGVMRVIFSGAKYLIEMIQKVPESEFPFTTEIIRNNNHLEFS